MDNHNSISYAEDWKSAEEPLRVEQSTETPDDNTEKPVKNKRVGKPLLTIIQIIICLLIVLSAYGIKLIGGELYKNVKSVYKKELNNEIILNPYENSLDKLINAVKN